MDLRQIKAFVAAFEKRSLTAGAVKVNATQPGLSVQIATLEAELGSKLFDRHARGLKPTFAGERFYPMAVSILRDVNDAVGAIRTLSGRVTGTFSIGVPPTLSKAILAPLLIEFTESFPDVQLRIVEAYSRALVPLVENKELDCALVLHDPSHPEVEFTPIYDDRFVLVSGPKLNLPPGEPIALNEQPDLKLVIPSLRYGLHQLLQPEFDKRRITTQRMIEIDGLSGTLKFIGASNWAGLLPFAAVHEDVEAKELHINPIAGDEIKIHYYLAQLATEFLPPAVRLFADNAARLLNEIASTYQARMDKASV
jgi:DNA-binding transcriptional LysR family regulator